MFKVYETIDHSQDLLVKRFKAYIDGKPVSISLEPTLQGLPSRIVYRASSPIKNAEKEIRKILQNSDLEDWVEKVIVYDRI